MALLEGLPDAVIPEVLASRITMARGARTLVATAGVLLVIAPTLAEQIGLLGDGHTLVRREYMTAIGPVDLLCRDADGGTVAVEVKRRAEIDGVEQLTRYLELLNRDPLIAPVTGILAAQQVKPQARTLAEDRGIRCVTVDYDVLRGTEDTSYKLF